MGVTEAGQQAFWLAGAGLFGGVAGSFFNVCIHRLPLGQSIVWPGSHCPECSHPIDWYDNLPVVSWLRLGGRCRHCRGPIAAGYPAVELLTAALFLLVAHRTLVAPAEPEWGRLAALGYLAGALVVCTFVDLRFQTIPDQVTLPGMAVAPALCALWPEIQPGLGWLQARLALPEPLLGLGLSLAGVAAGAGVVLAVRVGGGWLFGREAMGLGDVKLMGFAGGLLGPVGVLVAFLLGCLLGAVGGLLVLVVRRSRVIAFGPYLAAAALVVGLFPAEIKGLWALYRSWCGC